MKQQIQAIYYFRSSTNPRTLYETIAYLDGTASCNCRGWTFKRVTSYGQRSCTHTRMVAAGIGEQRAESWKVFHNTGVPTSTPPPSPPPSDGKRKILI